MQSIAPITSGKPALAANCASMSACSAALWEFDKPAEMQIIPSHSAGSAQGRLAQSCTKGEAPGDVIAYLPVGVSPLTAQNNITQMCHNG